MFFKIVLEMKKLLLLFLLFLTIQTDAQLSKSLSFEGILGVRLNILPHQDGAIVNDDYLVTSPLIGVKVRHQKYPFSLSYLYDRSYVFNYYPFNNQYDIAIVNTGNSIRLLYEATKFRYGLGHHWFKHETVANHILSGPEIPIRYIAFLFAVPFGQAEIEFQSLMRYTLFDVGDRYLQEINFKYHFGGQKKKEQRYATKFIRLNFLIGPRFFLPDQSYIGGERKVKLATGATAGAEILVEKFRTGLYWEKDWWIALNGGSPQRAIKGHITSHTFGVKYQHPLKEKRSLNFGLGYTWMLDASTLPDTRTKINDKEVSTEFYNNNIRGISIAPSFDFNRNIRIEIRQIIVTKSGTPERGIDLERLSMGIFYKIAP